MIHLLLFSTLWLGATLVLSGDRWARRAPIPARLQPYHPLGATPQTAQSLPDAIRTLIRPGAVSLGDRCSRALGISDSLQDRLDRLGTPSTVEDFRLNQFTCSIAAASATAIAVAFAGGPAAWAIGMSTAAAALVFMVLEQRLTRAVEHHGRQLEAELPVVAEQLGILLGAGYSTTVALQRVAARGTGAASTELARVVGRIGHGVSTEDALREWSERSRSDGVHRLVGVLTLGRHGTDLGSMIADEARAMRRDAQRTLIEQIERRAQLVWIPVTVAALAPGAVLIAVPFFEAFRAFTAP